MMQLRRATFVLYDDYKWDYVQFEMIFLTCKQIIPVFILITQCATQCPTHFG